jgi:hypothetical protein
MYSKLLQALSAGTKTYSSSILSICFITPDLLNTDGHMVRVNVSFIFCNSGV